MLLAALLALAWWVAHRRSLAHWKHLETVLDDLSAGRIPESFGLWKGGAPIARRLEKLAGEQQRLHQQISREESNLQTVLASMEEGLMVVDAQHVLRRVNPSFLKLFELKNDPRGQTVLRTLRETQIEEMVSAALKTGEPQTRDISMNGNKQQRHVAVHAVPMRDDEGQPGVVAIFRDMSRLKALEDVRREFVANVSHELRTPLSVFHGYVENLLDQPTMPRKEQAEVFHILRKHSLRLNALLEDLLNLARLETRHEKLAPEPLALAAFVGNVVDDWKGRAEAKKVTLTLEAAPELPPLEADPRRLEQVVTNLLENAIKYTEEGGQIRITAVAIGEEIELRVADTGIGIPPADLPHIFERFYRADKSRTREHGGTGLGLSIVKHIVQIHGGSVKAESTYGKGTVISLRLPLKPAVAD
ncbi:MAG: two-component system, OmpR family, phosphate regulon sensor histidine kinase PhoR [Chthoniobacter sp.]|nr:two-component system, OmpR family, phosphate regulon sensor histidine kinase PhoR [Chthoniobacter sp.]